MITVGPALPELVADPNRDKSERMGTSQAGNIALVTSMGGPSRLGNNSLIILLDRHRIYMINVTSVHADMAVEIQHWLSQIFVDFA